MPPTRGADVEHFPPTTPHAETRETTLQRLTPDIAIDAGHRRLVIRALSIAAIGGVIGAIGGLILSRTSGPFGVDSTAGTIGYMIVLGIAVAIIAGLVGTLLMLEREDGRAAHAIEERADREKATRHE